MKSILNKIILSAVVTVSFLTGCDKDEAPAVAPISAVTKKLSLNITPVVGSNAFDYKTSFTSGSGARYTISMFRYYLSNIRLIKNDGSEYPLNKYLLIEPSTNIYELGNVPVGNYKGIKFNVGIDSVTNHADPTVYPLSNPLAIQSPSIHWSWNSGYIFMMIEGTCDTTSANNGMVSMMTGGYDYDMFFHLGMDNFYTEVDLSNSPFSVELNADKTINVEANLNTLFSGINLKTENQTHTMNNMMLAGKAVANIPNMFSIVP